MFRLKNLLAFKQMLSDTSGSSGSGFNDAVIRAAFRISGIGPLILSARQQSFLIHL